MSARLSKVLMFTLLGAAGPTVFGQGVGGNSPTDTSHVLQSIISIPEHPINWSSKIGGIAAPVTVELDPVGPAWLKHFQTQSGNPINQNVVVGITEHLVVGGDEPWTGWRSEIMNPDFVWAETIYNYPFSILANGSPVAASIRFSGSTLDAVFPAIAPGAQVQLSFEFARVASNAPGSSFDMRQYPVPEPVSLMGLALLFLLSRGRR